MSTAVSKLIAIAKKEVGTRESPPDSNNTKYGEWFGLNGVAWCGIFVSWCFAQSGNQLPKIGFSKGFAGCQTAVKYFRDNKLIVDSPQPGDIVFYDWNGDGRYDHTGIFISDLGNNTFSAIEGNTSMKNQSNGGMVMERIRSYGSAIFARPKI